MIYIMLTVVLLFILLQYLVENVFKLGEKKIFHLKIIYLIVLCPITIFAALESIGWKVDNYKQVIRLLLLAFAFAITFVYITIKRRGKK